MSTVIKVENLSKSYRIGARQNSTTLRDVITNTLKSPFKKFRSKAIDNETTFWALKDINFEVKRGEVLGIIGRNGAGKSTLLKILSRITKPTKGKAELKGRVGSLLEVGTGFHAELTGRENIYLNGAILGMKHEEIKKKFDEIVAFAEYEQFLDTPVKHFSSGMYMRLAFSVAAHLEPEILIVDEVLAVGDLEFQKKCLGKMDEVSKTGRTILFVSHQMGTVAQLCQKVIMLDKGSLVMEGKTDTVIEHYINHGKTNLISYRATDSAKNREMFIDSSSVLNSDDVEQHSFRHDESIRINVNCKINRWVRGVELRMVIRNVRGVTLFTTDAELNSLSDNSKAFQADFTIPAHTLRPNDYFITLALFVPHQEIIELIEDTNNFSVFDSGTKYAQSEGLDYGLIFSPCTTNVKQIN
jgi:lipopolysaccharide transport system ATP-binding protein